MKRIFRKMFWIDKYYNLKWGIKNLFTYFKVTWKARPWDYVYSLRFLKAHLIQLRKCMDNGYEVRESLDLKLKDIDRCLEIINNIEEDNYIDRVGGFTRSSSDWLNKENWIYLEDGNYQLRETRTEEEIKRDEKVAQFARELENNEWNELWDIIKKGKYSDCDARGWWD